MPADNLTVNDFVTKFSEGFVHPNLFKVTFTDMKIKGNVELLGLACKSAKIPGVTYTEGKYSVDGKYRKFATGADLDPVEFVFVVDKHANGSDIISIFDEWGTAIYNSHTGEFGFKEAYECEILVEILDRAGNPIYASKLLKAYPTVITSFDLSFESDNQIMEYSITFNYERLINPDVPESARGTKQNNARANFVLDSKGVQTNVASVENLFEQYTGKAKEIRKKILTVSDEYKNIKSRYEQAQRRSGGSNLGSIKSRAVKEVKKLI
jgi:hypothetical protein